MHIVLSSTSVPLSTVSEYAETRLAQQISTVSGVAQVGVYGSQQYAVRIQLDPNALATRGIALTDIEQAVGNSNVNLPTGTLYGRDRATSVQATGQLMTASAYGPMIVAYRNGAPVRLNEIGRVFDSVQNDKIAAWFNGTRGIMLGVQRQPGTNTIEIVDAIRKILPTFEEQLPPSIKLTVFYDRSVSIRAAVHDVQASLLLALGLVVAVIFVFLRSVYATLIPSLALPMSIVGTFALMYAFGYSLDNLSLMALTLCVGFVVDDAIVMLENITRHLEMGKSRLQATLDGSKEIGFTIVSMTLSLVAVFIPVVFLGGILGRLLREFSVTIIVAVLISGFVSLTLTPMLCSRMLVDEHQRKHGRLYMLAERGFDAWRDAYRRSLAVGARAPPAHHGRVRRGDRRHGGAVRGDAQGLPAGRRSGADPRFHRRPRRTCRSRRWRACSGRSPRSSRQNPNVYGAMSSVGAGGPSASLNVGRVFVSLIPRRDRPERRRGHPAVARPAVAGCRHQGLRAEHPGDPRRRPGHEEHVPVHAAGRRRDAALRVGAEGRGEAPDAAGLRRRDERPADHASRRSTVVIDRNKASALGVSAQAIESTLYDAYGQRQVSTIYAPTNQYWVVMELEPRFQTDPSVLPLLYVRSSTGALVPLNSVATITPTIGPLAINHLGQLPAVTISFDLKPGVALSEAIASINRATAEMRMPETISGLYQGTAQAFQSSLRGMGILLVLAIFVIYLVLGILYESFIHPLTILSGLPTAGFGALVDAVAVRHRPQHVRVRRHHHAGRHREEERDHDDRLRDRGAAPGRQAARRGDLRGVHHALPADHDDDDGGADGQPADRARAGRGRRGAAAARSRRGRRSSRLAGAHALHHAGDLSVLRAAAGMARDAPRRRGAGILGRRLTGPQWKRAPRGALLFAWTSYFGCGT